MDNKEITNTEIGDCWQDLCKTIFKGKEIIILNVDNTNDDVNYHFHIQYKVANENKPRTQDLTFTRRVDRSGLANGFAIMKKRAIEGTLFSSDKNIIKKVDNDQQKIKGVVGNI